jgi:putative inorganic carbon (hco3(-)) transporter
MRPRADERLAFSLWGRKDVARAEVGAPSAAEAGSPSRAESSRASARRRDATPAEPRDWAFTWTLIFTAVLFLRPQDTFPPLEMLHLAELSALAGLVSLVVGRLARRQAVTRMTPEFAGVLALGAVILLTAPFSIWFGGAVSTFTDVYLKVMLVYLLAVNVLNSPKRIERLTWLLVLALGYLAFRAVFDYSRGVNMIARGTRVQGAVGGMMQNPNDLALHMVVFVPLALFMAMQPGPPLKRLIAAGAGFSMVGAVVASGSRGGFLGLALMLVVLGAFAARQRPAAAFAGLLVLICSLPLVPDQYWRRIASITDSSKDDYETVEARRELFSEAYEAFIDNPFTGVGAGQFKDYKPESRTEAWHETHNIWLQVASELGATGLAVFIFLMARAFGAVWQTRRLLARARAAAAGGRRAIASRRSASVAVIPPAELEMFDAHSAAMAASLAGFFVCAFFSSVAYNWTFYYLLVLAAAPRDILRAQMALASRRRTAAASSPAVLSHLDVRGVQA